MDNADFPTGKGGIDFDSSWRGERGTENSPELVTGKPLYGINHLVAQMGVGVFEGTVLPSTFGALLVSGGHPEILKVTSLTNDVQLLGSTIDDAAAEAYDKTERLLGPGYPGGPTIDKAAQERGLKAFRFLRGLVPT